MTPSPRLRRRAGALAWLGVAGVGLLLVAAWVSWIAIAIDGTGADTDFGAWFTAGRVVADGDGARLYDLSQQQQLQDAASVRDGETPFRPFVNPPHVAVAMRALAGLDGNTAYVAWNTLNLALLIGLAVAVVRLLRTEPLAWRVLAATATVGGGAVSVALVEGSLGIVGAVGLAAVAVGTVQERHGLVTAGVVAASVKPHLLVLPLLVLLVKRRWAPLRRSALAVVAVVAATVPLVGLEAWIRYPGALLAYGGPGADAPELAERWWNVAGALASWPGGLGAELTALVGWVTFLGSLVLVAALARRDDLIGPRHAAIGVVTVAHLASIVLAAHANPQDAVLVPFLAVWLWTSLPAAADPLESAARHAVLARRLLARRLLARRLFGAAAVAWPLASHLAAVAPGGVFGPFAVVLLLTLLATGVVLTSVHAPGAGSAPSARVAPSTASPVPTPA